MKIIPFLVLFILIFSVFVSAELSEQLVKESFPVLYAKDIEYAPSISESRMYFAIIFGFIFVMGIIFYLIHDEFILKDRFILRAVVKSKVKNKKRR